MTVESKAADTSALSTEPNFPQAPQQSAVANIFVGPDGIRAGWRLLIFFALFVAFAAAFRTALNFIPAVQAWLKSLPKNEFSPGLVMFGEGQAVLATILAALVMTKIEKKTFADYGLPVSEAFGKRFWQGVPIGLAMLSLLMGMIAALRGFSIDGFALHGSEAVRYGVLYGIAFLLVGFFEEFSFRGYLQATLGSGIGFWPAAIVLSIAFGAIHLGNTGEAMLGAVTAGGFGLVAAFSLRRTGTIWYAIGMHAAFDWGETYLYSVADSGNLAQGHLLNSDFHGATWLTGGTVGPEGSVLAILALLIWALAIHLLFPAKHVQA